jgi:two-component system chemotaxis response regulator CheY
MKVLIVDDAAISRTILRRIFEGNGVTEIVEAQNGVEAVRLYQHEQPDIVTMDLTMPDMDGYAAIRKIISLDPMALVIVCTALGQKDVVLEAIRLGAKHFLVKPFDPAKVISTVETVYKKFH